VFSVLPASRWQHIVVRRIGEWWSRFCGIASLPAGGMPAVREHTSRQSGLNRINQFYVTTS
jgi:hypothetical protein